MRAKMKTLVNAVFVLASLALAANSNSEAVKPNYRCVAEHAGGFNYVVGEGFENEVARFRLPFEWRLVTIPEAVSKLPSDIEFTEAQLYKAILDVANNGPVPQDVWLRNDASELAQLVEASEMAGYLLRRTNRSPDWYNYEACKSRGDSVSCSGWFEGESFVMRVETGEFTASVAPMPNPFSASDIFVARGRCTPFYD